jgi:hypothetical protein
MMAKPGMGSVTRGRPVSGPAMMPGAVRGPSGRASYLNVTQRALSVTQRALSVTQRALNVTQRALSVTQRALNVTQRALSVTQRALSVTQRASTSNLLREGRRHGSERGLARVQRQPEQVQRVRRVELGARRPPHRLRHAQSEVVARERGVAWCGSCVAAA